MLATSKENKLIIVFSLLSVSFCEDENTEKGEAFEIK